MATRRLFVRASDAEAYAATLARSHSPSARTLRVAYTSAVQAAEGGPAYIARSAHHGRSDDFEAVELTGAELRELKRQGMLREAESLEAQAKETEAELERGDLPRATVERRSGYVVEGRAMAARLRVEAMGLQVVSVAISEAEREQGAAE